MKVYWDTSAIITYYLQGRLDEIAGVTRPHTLAETFSALTGAGWEIITPRGRMKRRHLGMGLAARVLALIHRKFDYVDLTADEIVKATTTAKRKGAKGGRVHDLLHAVAAEKAGADELWTSDQNDFEGLGTVKLRYLSGGQ